jgi:hypothetical protein
MHVVHAITFFSLLKLTKVALFAILRKISRQDDFFRTHFSKDNFEPIFDVLVVLNKKLIALERNHLNLC